MSKNPGTRTQLLTRADVLEKELAVFKSNIGKLTKIGMALSGSTCFDELLSVILVECRKLLGADSGSVYLVLDSKLYPNREQVDNTDPLVDASKIMLFKEAQNDSILFDFNEMTMPVSKRSIAGYVAMTGEVLNIPDLYEISESADYKFNQHFDTESGYRSKSMLTFPMFSHDGEVLGVISLLNKKKKFDKKILSKEDAEENVVQFDDACENLGKAVASQAAVAIENNKLLADIRKLFDSFVATSVKAIEARDPSTAGHSSRVSRLALGLAKAVHESTSEPFGTIHYSAAELRCIQTAGLLHDFGKIGVSEHVLCKENKLYPHQHVAIVTRFESIRYQMKIRCLEQVAELHAAADAPVNTDAIGDCQENYEHDINGLNTEFDFLMEKTKPTWLSDEDRVRIEEIGAKVFENEDGSVVQYLCKEEIENFLIQKGSLNAEERVEIESHVSKSYDLLRKIPWTAEFDGMMDAIRFHHERENGHGYPTHMGKDEIPMWAMIIHVVDIFDALVASDRPYKPAMSLEKALHILQLEIKDGHLNKDLVNLFTEAKVYNVIKSHLRHESQNDDATYV